MRSTHARTATLLLACAALSAGEPSDSNSESNSISNSTSTQTPNGSPRMPMTVKKITPILYVDSIEPALPFWTERLGFEVTAEVPEGDALGFVILEKDGLEVMYQTRTSVENDVPALADTPMGGAFLFIEVDDVDAVEAALEGVEVVVPRRTTFYGADEIFFREPGGNVVGFASFGEARG